MPIPIPPRSVTDVLDDRPDGRRQHHLPDHQQFAVDQERARHDQALFGFGEYAAFVLLWSLTDFEAGRVDRCSVCYKTRGLVADVYKQSPNPMCPGCFGTTFEGGYKALIVRPSLWDTNEEDQRKAMRGETVVQTASVQSTSDFRMRTGDYILRADGSRWQMRTLSSNELRTGFSMPEASENVVGYNYGTCSREDESSVAYLIPPPPGVLRQRLDIGHSHHPQEFGDLEDVRGPLLS